ncbi:MAG: Ger(x)C family spore germination protein [Peptococcaceae bacterium]|nr:MAG: Ger(x)C family spore germination protein [Peptococcaceae bacterium]
MSRKVALLFLMIILVGLTGGCWSRKELSEMAIILGAGIDREPDGKVRLTLQITRPATFGALGGGEGGGGGTMVGAVWVVSGIGETVFDAQRNLSLQVSRRLYWGHNIILIFGESAARQGVREVINFFSRSTQFRETTWVGIAHGEAEEVLTSHSALEKTSVQALGFLERMKAGLFVEYKEFIRDLACPGTNPVAPRIELLYRGRHEGPLMELGPGYHKEAVLTGTAVFKDDRLVGWLDRSETRGLLWLRNIIKKGAVTVPSLSDPEKKITMEIMRSKTKVEPYYDGEKASFAVQIRVDGTLIEQQDKEVFTDPEMMTALEKNLAADVERKARSVLGKARDEYGVDIFGFGEAFHRKYKKEWPGLKEHWDEEFTRSDVDIAAEVRIRQAGMQARRLSVKKEAGR